MIYNPLAGEITARKALLRQTHPVREGGLLAGKYLTPKEAENVEENGRYDPKTANGQRYRARYMNLNNFDALQVIKAAIVSFIPAIVTPVSNQPTKEPEGLTFAEVALRYVTDALPLNLLDPDEHVPQVVPAS